MGLYLNPTNDLFVEAVSSEIYVDKTGLIRYTNRVLRTQQKYICVSRPRRFGKSMTAQMLSAYYSRGTDSERIFERLSIGTEESFRKYLNKFDVISINIQEFLSRTNSMDGLISRLKKRLLHELLACYPGNYFDKDDLVETMAEIYAKSSRPFVIIIDEWDCIFREFKDNHDAQDAYLDFLRDWLKDKAYVGLSYMTGILPIKKYGTHSALNMFNEFSMTNPGVLADFVGFTEKEVCSLCDTYHRDIHLMKQWYDGYRLAEGISIYNPRSVVAAMSSGIFDTYWNKTESFEALRIYLDMDMDGLKDKIISLLSGAAQKVDTRTFVNDMTTFAKADDVLTLMIHLGYLAYDFEREEVFIPNQEIQREYVSAISVGGWEIIYQSIEKSFSLLQNVWLGEEDKVAKGVENAHFETSQLQYNDENALSYTVSLAFYAARQYYKLIRELPAGKGFADMVFIPRHRYADKPAIIVELKWAHDADTAIAQVLQKKYPQALQNYAGEILLVGISYDKTTKIHQCRILKINKDSNPLDI